MIAVLIKIKYRTFFECCDHDRNPNKEDRNHGRTPIKPQKHDIFLRTGIIVPVLINSEFCENCDHLK